MTDEAGDESAAFKAEDWLSSAETIRRVRETTLSPTAHVDLARRAHAGLLRANARLMIVNDGQRYPDCDVPAGFWWAEGQAALTQNWELGDFETWIKKSARYRIFGVRFRREDVGAMLGSSSAKPSGLQTVSGRDGGGRPMSELWPEWVAELALHLHHEGVPNGMGASGADELIAVIADKLALRGLEAPARTTVQATAKAVLRRLRAEN